MRDLKSINRELNSRLEELSKDMKPPTGLPAEVKAHNGSQVTTHLKELNEIIGKNFVVFISMHYGNGFP